MGGWVYHISLIVADDQQRILMLPAGESWMPPCFTVDKFFTHLYLLTRRIEAELGAEMVMLRSLSQRMHEEAQVMDSVLLMDNLTTEWKPPEGSRWIDRSEVDDVILAEEWMRPALVHGFDTLMQAPSAKCPAWFVSGWFTEAAQWMSEALTAQGYRLLRAPEAFKNGAISAVLRTETDRGNVYFKVAVKLPLFGHEPKLTAALGALYPDMIQAPLAIDEARRWMLTADIGTELRENKPSLETLATVMKTYARLQIDSAAHLDQLFTVGCLDRRLDVLASQIDGVLADENCLQQLSADERAEWLACGDRLKALCRQLADYHLPYTLVHGDFHGGNIALQDGRIRFFDWTDACVGHPFFDLTPLLNLDDSERDVTLREAYLAEWATYEPLERLREVYAIGMILGSLHQVASYQGIYNSVEADQRADWAAGAPFFVRRVLKLMREKS